ncbi:MAG: hypothetical protein ACJ0RL_11475 [Porticoccaceae bacterium]
MRILSLKKLTPLLTLMLVSGCSVQSSQLSSLVSLIKTPPLDLSANSWLVRYSDYESVVYAVSTSEGTLFSNKAGDKVLFDGWMVRKVSGLGRRGLDIKIDELDGVRTFKQGARTLASHRCQEWQRETSSGMVNLSQNCRDRLDYSNSILVLEDGSISVIRQIVDERYTALTLTKLK